MLTDGANVNVVKECAEFPEKKPSRLAVVLCRLASAGLEDKP